MRLTPLKFVVLMLPSFTSVASEGLVDIGLYLCFPIQTVEKWVHQCNAEFPEFSIDSINELALWKERNSTKAEESHKRFMAEMVKKFPDRDMAQINELFVNLQATRFDDIWKELPRDKLMAYCKNMPAVLKQHERDLNEFLAHSRSIQ